MVIMVPPIVHVYDKFGDTDVYKLPNEKPREFTKDDLGIVGVRRNIGGNIGTNSIILDRDIVYALGVDGARIAEAEKNNTVCLPASLELVIMNTRTNKFAFDDFSKVYSEYLETSPHKMIVNPSTHSFLRQQLGYKPNDKDYSSLISNIHEFKIGRKAHHYSFV